VESQLQGGTPVGLCLSFLFFTPNLHFTIALYSHFHILEIQIWGFISDWQVTEQGRQFSLKNQG
jgi:hypothetical protein